MALGDVHTAPPHYVQSGPIVRVNNATGFIVRVNGNAFLGGRASGLPEKETRTRSPGMTKPAHARKSQGGPITSIRPVQLASRVPVRTSSSCHAIEHWGDSTCDLQREFYFLALVTWVANRPAYDTCACDDWTLRRRNLWSCLARRRRPLFRRASDPTNMRVDSIAYLLRGCARARDSLKNAHLASR